ncbi:MAG: DUF2341 domain-containing protein, partial [Candidatus Micrarchaeia archaeon]
MLPQKSEELVIHTTNSKAQSAFEYLVTYSWALLIIVIFIAVLYFFIFSPSVITPNSCSFSEGIYCRQMVLSSNSATSKVILLLANSQQYPLLNPQISINASNLGYSSGQCKPGFVLPGGVIICNISISSPIPLSTLVSGNLYFSSIPCPNGNPSSCSSGQRVTYIGYFNSHVSQLFSNMPLSISLSAQNTTNAAGIPDKLTAIVKMFGDPVEGATVNFTANQTVSISPNPITTSSSGIVNTYITSSKALAVKVKASFANVSSNTTITFMPPVYITFAANGLSPAAQSVLSLDGASYGYSNLPVTLSYPLNSKHSYSYFSPITPSGGGNPYLFRSIFGCGLSSESGTFVASSNCLVTAFYVQGTNSIIEYEPITITNSQSTATPAPFQQMVNITESNFSSYIAYNNNFANFEYLYANGTVIPAWIESNQSGKLITWVKLASGIPASNSITIYLGLASKSTNLLSNTGTTGIGEAPQLSSTYAEYDDGASVFNFYDNFAGTSLNTNKWTAAVSGGSITVNNGVSLNSGTSSTSNYAGLIYATSQNPSNIIIETLMNINGTPSGYARDRMFRSGKGTVISMGWGDAGMFGNGGAPQYYDGGSSGVSVPISSSPKVYNLFEQWQFPSTGTLTWTSYNNNGGSPGAKIFSASTTFTVATFSSFYTVTYDTSTLSVENIQWTRTRAYPPNGVMPSVSFTTVTISASPNPV